MRWLVVVVVLAVCSTGIAQDAENVEMVGRIYNYWEDATDVKIIDELAYVAAGRSGLQIVDVSDLNNINVIAYWDDNPGYASSIDIAGEFAFVADGTGGLRIISLNDPESPEEIAFCGGSGDIKDVVISGNYAYVADYRHGIRDPGGLRIISIAEPDDPEEVGYVESQSAIALSVSDQYAYLVDEGEGLIVINISDPENPEEVGRCEDTVLPAGVVVSDEYAYLCEFGGLCIISIADPENPEWIGQLYLHVDVPKDIQIADELLYVSYEDEGLFAVSLNDPDNPEVVGQFEVGNIAGIAIENDCAYVTNGNNMLQMISVENPENLEFIGGYSTGGYAEDVVVSGDYVYAANGSNGLCIVSIDPQNLEEVGNYDTPGIAYNVAVSGDYAYVADYLSGLRVVSVADPENPEEVGDVAVRSRDVAVSEDFAYVVYNNNLDVLSVEDPENPQRVGQYRSRYIGWIRSVEISGNLIFLCSLPDYDVFEDRDFGGKLTIISVEDPENPEEIGSIYNLDDIMDVWVSGDYAYLAVNNQRGLRVVSIADPANPREVGYYDSPLRNAKGIAVSGNYAYVTDWRRGLFVISIADPENPEEVGFFDTPGVASSVALLEDGLIYVADHSNLGIYRFTDPADVNDSFILPPSSFTLLCAYPNPFNSQTLISYQLPTETHLDLGLYDISGRQVMTLFSGVRSAGVWSTMLDGNGLVSGVYFIRLNSDEQQLSQKVVLIK